MQRLSSFLPALTLALAVSAAPATAQSSLKVVIQEGSVVLALGTIESFTKLAVTDTGVVIAEVNSDNPDGNRASAILRNGFLSIQEGLALANPPDATVKSWDDLSVNASGNLGLGMVLNNTVGNKNDDRGLFWNTILVAQEGTLLTAPGALTGMTPKAFSAVRINESNDMLVTMDYTSDEGNGEALFMLEVDGSGSVIQESLPLKKGDPVQTVTGGTLNTLGSTVHVLAFNNNGDWLVQAKLSGATGGNQRDTVLIKNGITVFQEGDESGIAGRTINDLLNVELGMNDFGDWVSNGQLSVIPNSGQDQDNAIIIKNGEIFIQESQTFPSIAPETIVSFGAAPVYIANSGDVFWYSVTNGPGATDAYYFRNRDVIIQEGVTVVNGRVVESTKGVSYAFHVSPNGRFWVGEVDLQGVGEALVKVDFGSVVPVPGCSANPGSLAVTGGSAIVGGDLTFEMDDAQAPGVIPFIVFSKQQAIPGNPCGINTNFGEVLIGLGTNRLGRIFGTPWNGTDPVTINTTLPNDLSLVDAVVWGQGVFFDLAGMPGVDPFQLTNGLRFEIGAP